MSLKTKKYYCGPDFFTEGMRKSLSKRFNESCFMHDSLYAEAILDRKEIDMLFLADMLGQSKTLSDKLVARLMYLAVRLFGWMRYDK